MRRTAGLIWSLLIGLSLCGCVEVRTYVGPRGTVSEEVRISVPQRFADGVRVITERLLGSGWKVRVDGKGEVWSVTAWRKFSSHPEGRPMPGVIMRFKRVNHWLRATYQLEVHYNPKELFETELEQAALVNVRPTVYIYMPGSIRPDQSNVEPNETGLIALQLDPLKPATIRLTSVGILWWRVGILLIAIGILIFAVAPYIPRIISWLRPTQIRVVEE